MPDRLTPLRPAVVAAAGLAAGGLVLALLLVREHAQAHAGIASFCALGEYVNCDRVATSRYSVVLGAPVAAWGALAYAVALALALAGMRRRRPHPAWPAGLLFLLGAAATAAAVALAIVSGLVIGALCILCTGSWIVSAALFAAAWRATSPGGVGAAVRADLAVLRSRPSLTAGVLLGGAAAVTLGAAAYPRYWERPRRPAPRPPVTATVGPAVVFEFSDYECPFCAKAHLETNALLAARPDVTIVRRNFPLDPTCNPLVKRRMHPEACALARAAICAEGQGKLEPMADLLFANQRAHRPVEELAADAGLDLPRFRACIGAPETASRLASDVAAGAAAGVRATPTYFVNGVEYEGDLPALALPPPKPRAK